jgi:hypothetical protein
LKIKGLFAKALVFIVGEYRAAVRLARPIVVDLANKAADRTIEQIMAAAKAYGVDLGIPVETIKDMSWRERGLLLGRIASLYLAKNLLPGVQIVTILKAVEEAYQEYKRKVNG